MLGHLVVSWYHEYGRNLIWRNTREPYKIWIAEIIMQQTRIEQGEGYFYRFIQRFPDLDSLANAELDEVLKYWEGLGYYSRARNLFAAAHQLRDIYGSKFPEHYTELLNLKGIGPYTARAIGSFAFDNETGVLDGNVLRVMSRVLNDFSPVNQQKSRKKFQEIIDSWVLGVDSRAFNHGMMDIGATICTPTKPACLLCPLESHCNARKEGSIHLLPYKEKKLKRKTRYFNFYMAHNREKEVAIRQRPFSGLWGGLWEIPNKEVEVEGWQKRHDASGGLFLFQLKHVFTHFDMMINVFELSNVEVDAYEDVQFISKDKISIFAFSKAVLKIFDETWQNTD